MKEALQPRTDFTFFSEAQALFEAAPQELATTFLHEPKMLPLILFELWRTNR